MQKNRLFPCALSFLYFLLSTSLTLPVFSQCAISGATFQGTTGIFTYEGELCFNNMEVNVHLNFSSPPYPTDVIIYVSNGNGPPPGFTMDQGKPGEFTYPFNGLF